ASALPKTKPPTRLTRRVKRSYEHVKFSGEDAAAKENPTLAPHNGRMPKGIPPPVPHDGSSFHRSVPLPANGCHAAASECGRLRRVGRGPDPGCTLAVRCLPCWEESAK